MVTFLYNARPILSLHRCATKGTVPFERMNWQA